MIRLVILLICLATVARAQDACPAAPDHRAEITDLIAQLQDAANEAQAIPLSDRLWRLWTDAPDQSAQDLLDRGMAQRDGFDFLGARDTFDELVEYCPDYAEGYNQRAFVSFLRQDYNAALVDLNKAIDLSPDHIAALSGKAMTLIGLNRDAEAQEVLGRAVALNPWLKERALLTTPPGRDI